MARRALTVEVDEKLLAAARAVAERAGVPADELYERALRDVLARDFADLLEEIAADQANSGVTLSDDEGLALAYDELRAARAERRNAS
jgi:membrane-bound ClpP family serine protease